jgi:hypothetical protein
LTENQTNETDDKTRQNPPNNNINPENQNAGETSTPACSRGLSTAKIMETRVLASHASKSF